MPGSEWCSRDLAEAMMFKRAGLAISVLLLSCLAGVAKDKKKGLLPADVLQAQTVLVVIDPTAGVNIEDPNANRIAQEDVEKALMRWGRFSPVMDESTADLVITVRKGTGRTVQPTVGGVPNNNRPVVFEPTDSGGRVGARQGNSGYPGDPSNAQSTPTDPHPEVEVGASDDMFVVYRGKKDLPNDSPLDMPPVWRYTAKNALESPDVPAVEAFRKLVADSDKQLAGKP
jgi:hypothetical protein